MLRQNNGYLMKSHEIRPIEYASFHEVNVVAIYDKSVHSSSVVHNMSERKQVIECTNIRVDGQYDNYHKK